MDWEFSCPTPFNLFLTKLGKKGCKDQLTNHIGVRIFFTAWHALQFVKSLFGSNELRTLWGFILFLFYIYLNIDLMCNVIGSVE